MEIASADIGDADSADKNDKGSDSGSDTKNNSEERKTESKKEREDEPRKTIVERVKELVSKETVYTITDINDKWNEFLKIVETRFPSLSFILKMGQIIGLNGDVLQIGVGYSFHRDKLMEKLCQKNLEAILEELTGGKVRLEFILNEEARMKSENDEIKELASSLGGEIVN